MKKLRRNIHREIPMSRDFELLKLIRLLRYGSEESAGQRTPLINVSSIARLLRISPSHVARLLDTRRTSETGKQPSDAC